MLGADTCLREHIYKHRGFFFSMHPVLLSQTVDENILSLCETDQRKCFEFI